MIGQTLAHYRITAKLGAGGMGEVYRATDTKLGREVALKMLPAVFAQDAERMARFQREAQVLASLNHPNIGAIYGLDEHDGTRFLVLELIEGHTLFDRIATGRIPQEDVLAICRQIAEAVEFAHEKGVVHRDLKPANVKVTDDGRVKVLDFGLAKALEDPALAASGSDPAQSPTMSPTLSPTLQSPITGALTGPNVILGTAAYMSPEQARGKPLDRRTDIFSFGCVFYEMLTGRRAFDGETVSDVIARILEREPDWSALPESTPERVRRILRRCLEKDPRKRQRDIGDVRVALEEIEEMRSSSTRAATPPPSRPFPGVARVVTAALIGAVGGIGVWNALRPTDSPSSAAPETIRFEVTAPPGARMFGGIGHGISPDGTAIVWPGADAEGRPRTWIRRLDSLESRALPSMASPASFWSADGRAIGFVEDGKLRTMSIDGGEPRIICDANSYRGASWGTDYIVFAGGQGPIFRVPATGGTPEPVTTVDESRGEIAHRFPHFLPDGETFLYVTLPGRHRVHEVYAGHVDGRPPVPVTRSLTSPVYASGYLVFQRGRRILAQAFDPDALALSGEPIDLGPAPELWEGAGSTRLSASRSGTLAYLTPEDPTTQLAWRDEQGQQREMLDVEPGAYTEVRFSPDGRHVALVREVSPEESDIWVLELERGILTRFTQGPGNHGNIRWAPDGAWIAYSTDADGPWNIYRKRFPAGGAAEPVVTGPGPFKNVMDWSPDGKWVLYTAIGTGTNMDLWIAPADGSGEPRPYKAEAFQEDNASFSPDGRWVAYVSDESGMSNVYIDSFPVPGQKRRVSIDGGFNTDWTRDGTRIRFVAPGAKLLEASVQTEPSLRTGIPEEVLTIAPDIRGASRGPDGRYLLILTARQSRDPSVTVVLNGLRRLGGDR